MKKLILMSAIVLGGLGIQTANAQLGIRINLNLGTRPVYVPAQQPEVVYNDYYYLPEVEAYYSVGENCYYYQDGERWIAAAYLPGRYHDFNWRTARRFEIHSNRPFMNHNVYRGRFGGFANRNDYYARAYPNRDRSNDRDRYNNDRDRNDNRGNWNQNRGGDDRRDDRRGGNEQPGRNQGGYQQPGRDQNQGGQQQQPGRGQGGYNQGGQQQQPSQGQGQQGGGRGNGQGQNQGGGTQPGNQNGGGRDRSNTSNGGDRYTANKMGVVTERTAMNRPVRN